MAGVKTYYRPRARRKKGFSLKRKRPGAFSVSFLGKKFFIICFVFLALVGFAGHFYLQYRIGKLEEQKRNLLLTKARLSAKISRLKKDPLAYEEIARRKYGLVKDNERLIIFR